MFVYLLLHSREPRFKIGKANDIWKRIYGIGGRDSFNTSDSLCVKTHSPEQAYKLERALHKLFDRWKIAPDPSRRFSGDTEQFDIACLDRVVRFLSDNQDLTDGAVPLPLPKPMVGAVKAERATKKEIYRLNTQEAAKQLAFAINRLDTTIDGLLNLKLERFEVCLTDSDYHAVVIETIDHDKFQRANTFLREILALRVPSGSGLQSNRCIIGSIRTDSPHDLESWRTGDKGRILARLLPLTPFVDICYLQTKQLHSEANDGIDPSVRRGLAIRVERHSEANDGIDPSVWSSLLKLPGIAQFLDWLPLLESDDRAMPVSSFMYPRIVLRSHDVNTELAGTFGQQPMDVHGRGRTDPAHVDRGMQSKQNDLELVARQQK